MAVVAGLQPVRRVDDIRAHCLTCYAWFHPIRGVCETCGRIYSVAETRDLIEAAIE